MKDVRQIDPKLREAGYDPSASAADAIAKLRELRHKGAADESAIARALGGIIAADAAAMLTEMETGSSGTSRREIRRALFRLRQHGIEAHVANNSSGSRPPESDTGLSALLSASDSSGARIAWLLRSRGSGGLRRLWALVSDQDGLLAANLESVTRKESRADRAEVERRAGTSLIEADWRLVDFIICDAYRRTPENRRARVGDFFALRTELIAEAPPHEIEHPVYRELADELASEPSAELMREPDIGAFRMPESAVKPYSEEIANLRNSVLVLNRVQQEERVGTIIERAIAALLTGDDANRLRRHLEDTAYLFAHSGRRTQAGWAAGAAARLRDHAELNRSAFFQAFMRAQLGAIIAEQQEESSAEPRLIMTPAEAMRARQAAQARMRGRGR